MFESSFRLVVLAAMLLVAAGKPNFVILFADDLGYGDIGCYGHPTSYTPNLDNLATEGLRFTDFYSSSPLCSPSRAALMTGRFQIRSGVYPSVFHVPSIGGLPHNETTIAEYLKEAGYSTGMVGKWHLGVGANNEYLPTNHGFDSYYGIPYSNDMCPCKNIPCFYPNITCDPVAPYTCEEGMTACPVFSNTTIIEQPADFLTLHERYTNAAVSFIKQQSAADNPFFLYFAFNHLHKPQYAGKQFTGSTIRGNFGDALTEMDDGVGQVMAALKEAGVDDNTFVFFTADNGPALWEKIDGGNPGLLKCGKGTTYEGGMREPAIAWWPDRIKPGVTRELSSTLDLLPTILKLVDVQPKEGVVLDGYDMSSLLFEGGESPRMTFFYYPTVPHRLSGVYAVRYKQYKAHFYTIGSPVCTDNYPDKDCRPSHEETKQDPPLLYNLHEDPSEIFNLTKGEEEYDNAMRIILEEKLKFEAKMTWGPSQMAKGRKDSNEPCANKGCSPFPECCHT
jgi:arylsulfatase A